MAQYSEIKNNQTIAVYTDITWASNGNLISDKIRLVGQENSYIGEILSDGYNDPYGNGLRTQFALDAINIDWNGGKIRNIDIKNSLFRLIDFGRIVGIVEMTKPNIAKKV